MRAGFELNTSNKTQKGKGSDIFIIKFTPDGEVLWATHAGGNGRNAGRCCFFDKKGNIFVTGSFEAPEFTIASHKLVNTGDADAFLLKLSPFNGGKK